MNNIVASAYSTYSFNVYKGYFFKILRPIFAQIPIFWGNFALFYKKNDFLVFAEAILPQGKGS